MTDSSTKHWQIDQSTYNKLQVLKLFVDFVAEQKETTPEHKANAEKIKELIKNLNKPESFINEWLVCIDIFNPILQGGNDGNNFEKNKGLYWKRWWVTYESGWLQIFCEDDSVMPDGSQDEKTSFYSSIYFEIHSEVENVSGDTDFISFIEDAKQFRKYITDDLNEVETDISFYL